jgi:hypothetical protein
MTKLSVADARALIVEYIKANPTMTYAEVGAYFGYHPSLIQKIAKMAGQPGRNRGRSLSKIDA